MEPQIPSSRANQPSSVTELPSKEERISGSSRFHSWLLKLFPASSLTSADYALASVFLTACFGSFVHGDIEYLGQNSLNFLFGNPLDFYDNAKKYQALFGAAYPPSLYVLFALWLYPWKLLGIITGPQALPHYLIYWLKIATSITYFAASYTFSLIAKEYFSDEKRVKYATAAWFTAPLAIFSQFIFSQTDIFYVAFTLLGYLKFLRGHLWRASVYFGLAVTFKDFPVASFLPLLLLLEKRLTRILAYSIAFAGPTLIFRSIYANSPALMTGVHQNFIERIYPASVITSDEALLRVYLLPLVYICLCGIAYFRQPSVDMRLRDCAYVWLVSSTSLFMFIFWHPQWLIMPVPAIVLTSVLSNRVKSFMTLDLLGMALFVGAVSLIFQGNVDASMFRVDLLGINSHNSYHNSYLMADLFNWFGDHSANMFLTGFVGYLFLQVILKYYSVFEGANLTFSEELDYGDIRRRLYVGTLLFLIPAIFVISKNLSGEEIVTRSESYEEKYAVSLDRVVEQTFVAEGSAISSISVLVDTYGRADDDDLLLELVDAHGRSVSRTGIHVLPTKERSWHCFGFDPAIKVQKGTQYSFRVISAKGSPENAFSLRASTEDDYSGGHATVDGRAVNFDLRFRIEFLR